MHGRSTLNHVTEAWEALRPPADSMDPRTRARAGRIDRGLGEMGRRVAEMRRLYAGMLRDVRAVSRRLGIPATRPLPPAPPSRPDPGPRYGVRYFATAAGPCSACGSATGDGPVAWRRGAEPGPVCNRCLKQLDPRLLAIPRLVHILREGGEHEPTREEERVLLRSLLFFAVKYCEDRDFQGLPGRRGTKWILAYLLAVLRAKHRPEWGAPDVETPLATSKSEHGR